MHKLKAVLFLCLLYASSGNAQERPNILWISSEDHGPHLGCYGDKYAKTPNIDRFAKKSLKYTRASSNAPVCAPARTTIISGMYPPATGSENMRSRVPAPSWLSFFPKYLQEAGYYTTNNHKEDYNLEVKDKGWDESSPQAHWKNRPEGKPFFAVFNYTGTHESQIRNENPDPKHKPKKAPVPPYHPDTPEVRKDWAQYYDRLTELDTFFQAKLDELEEAGLAETTIVMAWGDHGSGMPRSKRYPGWSGLHVPLIVHVPEKFKDLAPEEYKSGGSSDRLVGFVDFAPTLLSIAGIEPPDYYQGEAFMGQYETSAPPFSFGFRGRMDERPDFCRSVTDGRFIYIRNYISYLPHGQYLWYQQETPTTRIWYQKFKNGKLNEVQSSFWMPHPRHELYDLESDPHETKNLADDPEYAETLATLGDAIDAQMLRTRDLAFIPEPMLRQVITKGESPTEVLAYFFEESENPIKPALAEVDFSSEAWKQGFDSQSPQRRYWIMVRLREAGSEASHKNEKFLAHVLDDPEPSVAVAAAACLAIYPKTEALRDEAVDVLMQYASFPDNELLLSIYALNALDHAQESGAALPAATKSLSPSDPSIPQWAGSYRMRLIEQINAFETADL